MEADWSVALGADDPVIRVPWAASEAAGAKPRFVDLHSNRRLINEIEEARTSPVLRFALLRLNAAASPLWTAKCDTWNSSAEEGAEPFDPREMDAAPEETAFGAGSYIDLLARDTALFLSFDRHERWIRAVTDSLRRIAAPSARIELVLRHAEVHAAAGFAVTWFVEGCGSTLEGAGKSWSDALQLALDVIMDARLMEPR
jgi:hypothetical protein